MFVIRKRWFWPTLAAMAMFVAGCAQDAAPGAQSAASTQEVITDSAGRPVADLIAGVAIANPPGHRVTITLEDGRQVTVWVGQDYIAASQERCRRITFQFVQAQRKVSAVCFQKSAWRTVIRPN